MNPFTFFVCCIVTIGGAAAAVRARNSSNRGVSALVAVVFFILSFLHMLRIVPAGHVGVVVLFGNVSEKSLPNGMHLVIPFASVEMMSVRTQESFSITELEPETMREPGVRYHPLRKPHIFLCLRR